MRAEMQLLYKVRRQIAIHQANISMYEQRLLKSRCAQR